MARLAYAGSNEQPYRSVGGWLLQQRALTDASWPGIKAWARANPQRVQEMLWSNPRVVFFREEPLSDLDAAFGPRGAQGVPLTPGRSIAVDKDSIPYGTPVWLSSPGPVLALNGWCSRRTPAAHCRRRAGGLLLSAGGRRRGRDCGKAEAAARQVLYRGESVVPGPLAWQPTGPE
jgi:hypothetical protein